MGLLICDLHDAATAKERQGKCQLAIVHSPLLAIANVNIHAYSQARDWRLEKLQETAENAGFADKRTNKRSDGAFWCCWRENGTGISILDDSGVVLKTADVNSSLAGEITAMDVVDCGTVAFGSSLGASGIFVLGNGSIQISGPSLAGPVTDMWTRLVNRSWTTVAFCRTNCRLSITSLATRVTRMVTLRHSSVPFRCLGADVDHNVQTVAMHDGAQVYLWDLRYPDRSRGVRGLYLEEDEKIVSLKFATRQNSMLIATSRRLFVYDFGSCADLVCDIREKAFYDFFDSDSKIVVEQEHLYGTHIACFSVDQTTARWVPLGYSDIRAQFGIRDIRSFYALRSRLLVFSGSDACYQLATTVSS
ncbi:LAFA_0G20494g1_1 [Lachancea sp. 'fantastica']|nr:LAFA_0G20494g1_1 [Lachancea sp. 'fantastica']